jgi:Short C-terminal domain
MKSLSVFATMGMLLLPAGAFAKDQPPPPEPATHPNWSEVRAKGQAELTKRLFDPGSAQIAYTSGFIWGYTKHPFGKREWGWVACGKINAKNRLGGYAGAQGFWIMANLDGTVTQDMTDGIFRSSCDDGPSVPLQPELVDTPTSSAPSSVAAPIIADELGKLAVLRDKGIITPAEFEAQKVKLLAR